MSSVGAGVETVKQIRDRRSYSLELQVCAFRSSRHLKGVVHIEIRKEAWDSLGKHGLADSRRPEAGLFVRSAPDRTREHRRDGNFAVRLGLTEVQGIGRELAERIVQRQKARFIDINDVIRHGGLTVPQAEALASQAGCRCRAAFADKRDVQSGFERLIP